MATLPSLAGGTRALVAVLLVLVSSLPARAARFTDVRVTDAVPTATGANLTLDLDVPPSPGPHPVLLVVSAEAIEASSPALHAVHTPGWLQARVRLRAGVETQDLADTLAFVTRQIGAWAGDHDRVVVVLRDALWPVLIATLAEGRVRVDGVVMWVVGASGGAASLPEPAAGIAMPLLLLFDPAVAVARRDALRIAASWRRAGARADVLPAAQEVAGVATAAFDDWASALATPRLARWEALVPSPEEDFFPRVRGRAVGIVAHDGALHVAVQDDGVHLWTRRSAARWERTQVWPAPQRLVWLGVAATDAARLYAVLHDAKAAMLWIREAAGRWVPVARAPAVAVDAPVSRVVAVPERAVALWLADTGTAATTVHEVVASGADSPRVRALPSLAGRLVDTAVHDGAVMAATRHDGVVTLWRHDAIAARWSAQAQLDAQTRTLAAIAQDATLLAFGTRRVERLDAGAVRPHVELEVAEAFAAMLDVPARTAIRAVGARAARLVHPQTGELALALGIDVADPDPRAPAARYLVRDAKGRYAIGEAWEPASRSGGWPQDAVIDPADEGLVHWLPAAGDAPLPARLPHHMPRRGLWRAVDGDGWLAFERIGPRWAATLVLADGGGNPTVRVATGVVDVGFTADAPGALDPAGVREPEPLHIAFAAQAAADCAGQGVAGAWASLSLGAGDNVRQHCFLAPAGSALPTGLNGAWMGGEGADRWFVHVDATVQAQGTIAEVLMLVRDRAGAFRVVRGSGVGDAGALELPLYATCAGCGPRPIGSLRMSAAAACGDDPVWLGFVLLLPDVAGYHQRAYGPIDRFAGPACY